MGRVQVSEGLLDLKRNCISLPCPKGKLNAKFHGGTFRSSLKVFSRQPFFPRMLLVTTAFFFFFDNSLLKNQLDVARVKKQTEKQTNLG